MYIRKNLGPRVVTLPDGRRLTRGDLPAPTIQRWTAERKARVAEAVAHGLLSEREACRNYGLAAEELREWLGLLSKYGRGALKVTKTSARRAGTRRLVNG